MHVLVVDAVALLVYVVCGLPQITGVDIHEWLGLAVLVVLFVHSVQHYDWVQNAVRRTAQKGFSGKSTGRILLDIALIVALAATMVTGIMESGAVLAALGMYAEGYYFWNPAHAVAAKVLLALVLVHLALDAGMAWRAFQSKRSSEEGGDEPR